MKAVEEIPGIFEVELAEPYLTGSIEASIYVQGEDDDVRIIGIDDPWGINIDWYLKGTLLRFLCGSWCVCVIVDCMCGECKKYCTRIPVDGCHHSDGHYHTTIDVPAGIYKDSLTECSYVCKVVIVITLEDACGKPGPIAGMVEGPIIQFYEEGPEGDA